MEKIKELWPRWEIVEKLGEGGFGKVYKVKRNKNGKEEYSAIKVIKIPNDKSEFDEMKSTGFTNQQIKDYYSSSIEVFKKEIDLMIDLASASHIVTIKEYEIIENEVGWCIYIQMELLTDLPKYYREKQISVEEVVKMGIHILTALETCHKNNIIHRDIKPNNIFVSKHGEYKLGDFGVSREVEKTNATMSQKGTKSYMAPEMVRMEKSYNQTVDIYALGLTMYELLNHGRMPFLPPYPEMYYPQQREEAMLKRLNSDDIVPEIEGMGEVNAILQKACHPKASYRYQNATEMKKALLDIDFIDTETISDSNQEDILNFDNNDATIGIFKHTPLFSNENENNNDLSAKIKDYIINDFKSKYQIDLNRDALASRRIDDVVIKIIQAFKTEGTYSVDLPYIAMNNTGPLHLKIEINKNDLYNDLSSSEFLFDNGIIEEDIDEPFVIQCPHCGGRAVKVFTHGYHCHNQECLKIMLNSTSQKTKDLQDVYVKWFYNQKDISLAKQMTELDPNSPYGYLWCAHTYGLNQDLKNKGKCILQAEKLNVAGDGRITYELALYFADKEMKAANKYYKNALRDHELVESSIPYLDEFYINYAKSLSDKEGQEIHKYIKKAYQLSGQSFKDFNPRIMNIKNLTDYYQEVVNMYFENLRMVNFSKVKDVKAKLRNKFYIPNNEIGMYRLYRDNLYVVDPIFIATDQKLYFKKAYTKTIYNFSYLQLDEVEFSIDKSQYHRSELCITTKDEKFVVDLGNWKSPEILLDKLNQIKEKLK